MLDIAMMFFIENTNTISRRSISIGRYLAFRPGSNILQHRCDVPDARFMRMSSRSLVSILDYPVGLVGTPLAIKNWDLPNPVLGPSMYDHPRLNPTLMQDERFRYYLLTCEWLRAVSVHSMETGVLWACRN